MQAPCHSAQTSPGGAGATLEKMNPIPQPQGVQDGRRAESRGRRTGLIKLLG